MVRVRRGGDFNISLMWVRRKCSSPGLCLAFCALPGLGWAHEQAGGRGDFTAGLAHPVTGIDHVLAMVAVGMWGAQLGTPAIWVLPVAFPLIMALGAVAGILGLPVPAIEPGIALSVIALGTVIAAQYRPPLWVAVGVVSVFAVFHGYSHGLELPRAAAALPFGAGFVLATGLLHLFGIALGLITRLPHGARTLRLMGGAVAVGGALLLARLLVT